MTTLQTLPLADATPPRSALPDARVEAVGVSCRLGGTQALADVSFEARSGEIHALLGPNGAGKTTLLRTLSGLIEPASGRVAILGENVLDLGRAGRQRVGLVPSGDRSFYLRLSGLENVMFFARLHGFPKREAMGRGREVLRQVGLEEATAKPVGQYSHGMQKRLSVARSLLTRPSVLLVDEATHDLDPRGAELIRELFTDIAASGAAVVWATQRLDEVRGFADRVTVLDRGKVRFVGSVSELMAQALPTRYLVQLRDGARRGETLARFATELLGGKGLLAASEVGGGKHFLLALEDGAELGEAISLLSASGVKVVSCREEQSQVEQAFLRITDSP